MDVNLAVKCRILRLGHILLECKEQKKKGEGEIVRTCCEKEGGTRTD